MSWTRLRHRLSRDEARKSVVLCLASVGWASVQKAPLARTHHARPRARGAQGRVRGLRRLRLQQAMELDDLVRHIAGEVRLDVVLEPLGVLLPALPDLGDGEPSAGSLVGDVEHRQRRSAAPVAPPKATTRATRASAERGARAGPQRDRVRELALSSDSLSFAPRPLQSTGRRHAVDFLVERLPVRRDLLLHASEGHRSVADEVVRPISS